MILFRDIQLSTAVEVASNHLVLGFSHKIYSSQLFGRLKPLYPIFVNMFCSFNFSCPPLGLWSWLIIIAIITITMIIITAILLLRLITVILLMWVEGNKIHKVIGGFSARIDHSLLITGRYTSPSAPDASVMVMMMMMMMVMVMLVMMVVMMMMMVMMMVITGRYTSASVMVMMKMTVLVPGWGFRGCLFIYVHIQFVSTVIHPWMWKQCNWMMFTFDSGLEKVSI